MGEHDDPDVQILQYIIQKLYILILTETDKMFYHDFGCNLTRYLDVILTKYNISQALHFSQNILIETVFHMI